MVRYTPHTKIGLEPLFSFFITILAKTRWDMGRYVPQFTLVCLSIYGLVWVFIDLNNIFVPFQLGKAQYALNQKVWVGMANTTFQADCHNTIVLPLLPKLKIHLKIMYGDDAWCLIFYFVL